jgi:hypothetical protein
VILPQRWQNSIHDCAVVVVEELAVAVVDGRWKKMILTMVRRTKRRSELMMFQTFVLVEAMVSVLLPRSFLIVFVIVCFDCCFYFDSHPHHHLTTMYQMVMSFANAFEYEMGRDSPSFI